MSRQHRWKLDAGAGDKRDSRHRRVDSSDLRVIPVGEGALENARHDVGGEAQNAVFDTCSDKIFEFECECNPRMRACDGCLTEQRASTGNMTHRALVTASVIAQ